MYTIGQFAKLLNISVKTIQRWDREGILKSKRTPTGRRYYSEQDLLKCKNQDSVNRKIVPEEKNMYKLFRVMSKDEVETGLTCAPFTYYILEKDGKQVGGVTKIEIVIDVNSVSPLIRIHTRVAGGEEVISTHPCVDVFCLAKD